MHIQQILESKPHNAHYLRRYLNYISSVQKLQVNSGYIERHHIVPKSMWPEFTNLDRNPWNLILMTRRQHEIAHWILWKIFDNLSMCRSFAAMTNSKKFPMRIASVVRESVLNRNKILSSNFNKNTAPAKHSITNESLGRVEKDDPRWKTGEIVSANKGQAPTAIDAKSGMNLGAISKDDPRWETMEIVSVKSGKCSAKDPCTGQSLGWIDTKDPRWKTGEIVGTSKGNKCSNEVKELLSKLNKGKSNITKEGREKISSASKGKKLAIDSTTKVCIGKVLLSDPRWKTGEIVGALSGENNPQSGTKWIQNHSEKERAKVPQDKYDFYLSCGWSPGFTMSYKSVKLSF